MNPFQWLAPWDPSETIFIALMLVSAVYIHGRGNPSLWQKLSFWVGALSVYAMCDTKFDYYAEHEFFVHRIQHVVLHHIAPFLIVLSKPGNRLASGLPLCARHQLNALMQLPSARHFIRILMNPFLVTVLFVGLIYLWLIPPVHFIAMLDWHLYRLMNWGVLVNGLMFWGLALGKNALSAGSRLLMMLAIIPPQIIIGAVIFYASHELYPIYTLCGRAFGELTPLADQQIGGLILWICGSMMSVIGILIVTSSLIFREVSQRRAA